MRVRVPCWTPANKRGSCVEMGSRREVNRVASGVVRSATSGIDGIDTGEGTGEIISGEGNAMKLWETGRYFVRTKS